MKRALAALFLALLPAPLRARADAPSAQTPPPPRAARPELSKEDQAMLREMALLERVELLLNLELFEPKNSDGRAAEAVRPP